MTWHIQTFFEYNDWMEIYNAEDTVVQLAGYHLSDDPDNLTKYTIPDTDAGTTFPRWPSLGCLDGSGQCARSFARQLQLSSEDEAVVDRARWSDRFGFCRVPSSANGHQLWTGL